MTNYKLRSTITFTVLLIIIFSTIITAQPYLDSTLTINERIEDLLGRMTLDEKIGQMCQAERNALEDITDIQVYGLGSLLSGGGSAPDPNTPAGWADMYDNFQSYALNSRLGIPLMYGIDAVHGHNNVYGAVIFPHNIGLGATWNPDIVEAAARITAKEVAATGIDWNFAPCIAVVRDERWGRTYEGFGETPELQEMMSEAAVRGYEGDDLSDKETIAACAKHYIGDGGTTGGVDQGNTQIDEAELRELHLPGYISAIEQGVRTVMASYNSWNGEKLHGHKYLLTDVLKVELGFEGFVISDWAGIDQLPGDYESDIEQSINAGIDMVMVPNQYKNFLTLLKSNVQNGKISQERIDDAVRRILKVKFELGLFENPYTDRSLLSSVGSYEHRQVARQAVRESLVLLKKKDNVLPLSTGGKILVAGKNADNLGYQCGGWSIYWQGGSGDITEGTTILEAIRNAAPSADIVFSESGEGAEDADVAVVVVGETPYAEGAGDRSDLTISASDVYAIRNAKSAGIPVVVILISGRPMIINPILYDCDALIAAWLPGTEGDGVADILFGKNEPVGKLSHTWPKNMQQIPINFGDADYSPLFEYKYGINTLANSAPGSSPEFYAASTNSEGTAVNVAFNKEMVLASDQEGNFTVLADGRVKLVTGIELNQPDNTSLALTLDSPVEDGSAVTISFSNGSLRSADGGVLTSFSEQDVYPLHDEKGELSAPGKIEAEDYTAMSGIQTEDCQDIGGGLNVGWIDDGDYLDYNISVNLSGMYHVTTRIASASSGGKIDFILNSEILASVNVPVTGGWQNWQSVGAFINLAEGSNTYRLYANEGGFNLNWFEFSIISDVKSEQEIPEKYSLSQNYPNPFNPTTTIEYSLPVNSWQPAVGSGQYTESSEQLTVGSMQNRVTSIRYQESSIENQSSNQSISQSIELVQLKIYDMLGQEVTVLVNEEQSPGTYSVDFNAGNLPSGIYLYKLSAGSFVQSRKMVLLK